MTELSVIRNRPLTVVKRWSFGDARVGYLVLLPMVIMEYSA